MLRRGNTKLGDLIHQWSIPAGLAEICVGATEICLLLCYAKKHHYLRKNVQNSLKRNYKLALRKDFYLLMIGWVRSAFAAVVRVHPSGEFFSAAYVNHWIRIANACKRIQFFAYTRSWRNKKLIESLEHLGSLSNFELWWSCDKHTGKPPRTEGVRIAYMIEDDLDIPPYHVDLFFRAKRKRVLKWVNRTLVCPVENGITKTTCSHCKICFNKKPVPLKKENLHVDLSAGKV